jgi:hypothetical protein
MKDGQLRGQDTKNIKLIQLFFALKTLVAIGINHNRSGVNIHTNKLALCKNIEIEY